MKRFLSYFYGLLLVSVTLPILSACGETDPDNGEEYPAPFYVADKEMTFEDNGGYQLLYVQSVNIAWQIECAAEWVTASPASGAYHEAVRVDVKPNPSESERSDTLWVRSTSASYPQDFPVRIFQKGLKKTD